MLLYTYIPHLVGIVVFLLLNSVFTAGEVGLLRLRFSHFNTELLENLRKDRRFSRMIENPDWAVRAMRVGILICTLGYAINLFPILFAGLQGGEAMLWGEASGFAVVAAFFLAVALHFAVAEVAPRALGLGYPRAALSVARVPTVLLAWLSTPLLDALQKGVERLLGMFGVENRPEASLETLDLEAQIEGLHPEGESPLSVTVTQRILRNTLRLRELQVGDVILPRKQVLYFDVNLDVSENLAMAREAGHTRYPLCDGDLDRCIGLIHIKDLFRYPGDLRKLDLRRLRRDIIRIDSEESLESALAKLLAHRMHMALVIDEFRGTEGVLTLEQALETLVGDIRDEFDADEEALIKGGDDPADAVVSGLALIHELEERFNVELDDEEVSTVGGLITTALGRIPDKDEQLEIDGLHFTVTEVDETRVIEARVRRMLGEAEGASDVSG